MGRKEINKAILQQVIAWGSIVLLVLTLIQVHKTDQLIRELTIHKIDTVTIIPREYIKELQNGRHFKKD